MNSPWQRVFLMVTGFLLAFLVASFVGFYWWNHGGPDPWIREMESTAKPEGADAMRPVLEALPKVDWEVLAAGRERLQAAAVGGWKIDSADLAPLLEKHSFLVTAAQRSAAIPVANFPPLGDRGTLTIRPRFERLELVNLLLGANARRLEAEGHTEEALQREVELALLGNRFARPSSEATLTHHLVALSALEIATNGIVAVLENQRPSPEVLVRLEAQLLALETSRSGVAEGIQTEMAIHHKEVTDAAGDPAKLEQILMAYDSKLKPQDARREAQDLVADALSFAPESGRVYGELEAAMRLPCWERPRLDQAWLEARTTNRLLRRQFLDPSPLLARECLAVARLRLARGLCLHALGRDAELDSVVDPYTGKPLRRTEETLYSIGPDAIDDGGTRAYQPADGVWSSGDVVMRLRAAN